MTTRGERKSRSRSKSPSSLSKTSLREDDKRVEGKRNILRLPLFPDGLAVAPQLINNREVVAVACSSLTGESWHGEICIVDTSEDSSPVLQQRLRTYGGNTCVTWMKSSSTPLLLSSGDDGCVYLRTVQPAPPSSAPSSTTAPSGVLPTGNKSTTDSTSTTSDSSDPKFKKKKKKKKILNKSKSPTESEIHINEGGKFESNGKIGPPRLAYQITAAARFMDHADSVTSIHSHPTVANQIVSSSMDSSLKIWDVEASSTPERTLKAQAPAWVARWGPSSLILAGYQDGYLRLWDVRAESGSEMDTSSISSSHSTPSSLVYVASPIFALAWHPTIGNVFIAGTEDGSIHAFDCRNLKQPITSNADHLSSVRALEFSQNNSNFIYSSSDDTTSRLFEFSLTKSQTFASSSTANFNSRYLYSEQGDYVRAIGFGLSSKYPNMHLWSGSWDQTLHFQKVSLSSSEET